MQQLFAAEESFAPFIEAVEEAAGSDDPAEQEAASHAATVIAEDAPAAVDGMSAERSGTAAEGNGKGGTGGDGRSELSEVKQDSATTSGSKEERENGGDESNGATAELGADSGGSAIPVPTVVEAPPTEMRESWMENHTTEEILNNVLLHGSVSGLILHEADRKEREENGTAEQSVAPENGGKARAEDASGGTVGASNLSEPQSSASGLRQRSVHKNGSGNGEGNGKGGVDTGELEAHAVQSAAKEPDRGEETKEEAGMDLESRNRRREYLQRYRFLWDDQMLEVSKRLVLLFRLLAGSRAFLQFSAIEPVKTWS